MTEREPNQQVLQYVWQFTNRAGELELSTNTVVELAAGLNRYDPQSGGYVPCRAEWELTRDGYCLARQTQHQVILYRELAAAGAVDCLTADGLRLRSTLRGVALVDAQSGQSVWLAEVQSVQPDLVSPGEVVYRDGCTGLLRCDVRYRLGLDRFEQEVLLKEQVPADVLAAAGIAAEQARLLVLTEFFDPPPPIKRASEVVGTSGQRVKDQELQFGAMTVRRGLAFALAAEPLVGTVPVAKSWEELEGRPFLIESVRWTDLAPLLRNLPLPGQAGTRSAKDQAWRTAAVTGRLGLPALPRGAKPRVETVGRPLFRDGRLVVAPARVRQARVHLPAKARMAAVVLDYPLELTSAQSNYTFQADKTYYISGAVTLTGTTKLEGGAVLKYAPDATLDVRGPLECLTGPYRPVVLTAKLDNTVGESVTNGTPSGYYANPALRIDSEVGAPACVLTNLRVAWADRAIVFETGSNHFVAHAQFVNCREALCPYTAEARVWNALFANTVNAIDGIAPATVHGAHWTVDGATALNCGTNATLYLTNSLVVAVSGHTNFTGTGTVVLTDSTGVFQAVGAGGHYLPEASPYRLAGPSTAIGAVLLNDLSAKTTDPPLVLSGTLTGDLTLRPRCLVGRNWSWYGATVGMNVDLGYYYDPIDFAVGSLTVSGTTNQPTTLTLQPGAALAAFGDNGLVLEEHARLIAQGQPERALDAEGHRLDPVRLFRYPSAQEQSTNWGNRLYEPSVLSGPIRSLGTNCPSASLRFVDFYALGGYGYHIYTSSGWCQLLSLELRDCQLRGGKAQLAANWQVWNGSGYVSTSVDLNNNLFERVGTVFAYGPVVNAYHNLFWGGTDTFAKWGGIPNQWSFFDNAFHGATLVTNGTATIANGYNAYIPTNLVRLPGSSGNDVPLACFPYATGPLGNYYHGVTNLIDAGSRNATNSALYHYTTQTRQTRETNTTVDIGWHYVAAGPYGVPLDTDGEGLCDYQEDQNGNGVYDTGYESDWQNRNSDADGANDALELLWGTNPRNPDSDVDGLDDNSEVVWSSTDPLDYQSTQAARLSYWRFDNASLTNEAGVGPLTNVAVTLDTNSFDGLAPNFSQTGTRLSYPAADATNKYIAFRHGSVRFWYLPNWYQNGSLTPPGAPCTLLQVGAWKLNVTACGRWLVFESPSASGWTNQNLRVRLPPCSAPFSGRYGWEIVLNYTRHHSWVVINGGTAAASPDNGYDDASDLGSGVEANPPLSDQVQGLFIGSSPGGLDPAQGLIDDLETFNGAVFVYYDWLLTGNPFTRVWNGELRRAETITASAPAGTNYLQVQWIPGFQGDPRYYPTSYAIQRRAWSDTTWTNLATGVTTNRHADYAATNGVLYEYRVNRANGTSPTIAAARQLAPQHRRGKALLLVESGLYTNIVPEFQQFVTDLRLDGWQVATNNNLMPRHLDFDPSQGYTLAGYSNDLMTVSNRIALETNRDVVVLLGHITIPYAGYVWNLYAEDDHWEHIGAWPADLWYGHPSGLWTDTSVNHANAKPALNNITNDCKWDQSGFPADGNGVKKLEIAVGRIDFANMFDFIGASYLSNATNVTTTERALMTNYFNKARWYRTKQIGATDTWRAFIQNGTFLAVVPNARSIKTRLLGTLAEENRFTNDVFVTAADYGEKRYLWGLHGAFGGADSIQTVDNSGDHRQHSRALALPTNEPQVVFYLLSGSWFVDWNWDHDNFMRACLSTLTNGLAAVWTIGTQTASPWRMDRLALGYHLGAMLQDTIVANESQSCRAVYVLGDTTLCSHTLAPPQIQSAVTNWTGTNWEARLTWTASPDAADGHFVHRGTSLEDAQTNQTWWVPPGQTSFTNSPAASGTNIYYLLSAARLTTTGCGSFTNLSYASYTIVTNIP